MYCGKRTTNQKQRRSRRITCVSVLILSLLLLGITVRGVSAYLLDKSGAVVNTFIPSEVSGEVTEDFDGEKKTNVNVKNTSDIDVYIRVRLVSYRVNEDGEKIGGIAEIPTFMPGTGWVKNGEYYYYKNRVAPGKSPETNLVDEIVLIGNYEDADGGKQVIEVIAEVIQADGVTDDNTKVVVDAWGTDPETLGN